MTLRIDTYESEDVQKLLPGVLRSFQRAENKRFARTFLGKTKPVELVTDCGIRVGETASFELDLERVNKITAKFVRALYYHETENVLNSEFDTMMFCQDGLEKQWQSESFVKCVEATLNTTQHSIGNCFDYWYRFVDGKCTESTWILRFYQRVYFVGVIIPSSNKR